MAAASVLPCSLHIWPKGRHPKKSASWRISSLAIVKTASKHIALDSTSMELLSVNSSHHCCLTGNSKQSGETVSCFLCENGCTKCSEISVLALIKCHSPLPTCRSALAEQTDMQADEVMKLNTVISWSGLMAAIAILDHSIKK